MVKKKKAQQLCGQGRDWDVQGLGEEKTHTRPMWKVSGWKRKHLGKARAACSIERHRPALRWFLKWVWGSCCLQFSAYQQPEANPALGARDHLHLPVPSVATARPLDGTGKISATEPSSPRRRDGVDQLRGWAGALGLIEHLPMASPRMVGLKGGD